MKILLSFFDHTGNASRPFEEDNSWQVMRFDIKDGYDIMNFNPSQFMIDYLHGDFKYILPEIGIIAMIPCTGYALCGNRHKNTPQRKIIFEESQKLVAKVKEVIDFFDRLGILKFWQIENPMSDIHKHNKWMGKIRQSFDPCDFAGYDPIPDNSRYNKRTWLWGNFNLMTKKRIEPFKKNSPVWENIKDENGKILAWNSEKIKELRSITPLGFAYAFYDANK